MSKYAKIKLPVLQEARKMVGHLAIKSPFVVPKSKEWSPEFHGFDLGKHIAKIRQNYRENKLSLIDVEKLTEINFVADLKQFKTDRILLALNEFKRNESHCNVLKSFTIPSNDSWSKVIHGLKLGNILSNMRNLGCHESIHEEVLKLGFSLDPKQSSSEFSSNFSALESYKAVYGHVKVPHKFVVPHGDARYPENTWGMKLGQHLHSIRCNGAWPEHRAELEALGVNYEVKPVRNQPFDVIYSALKSYKAVHGDVIVAQRFVIPRGDARYPENTWGMNLGRNLHSIRTDDAWPEHRAQLEALGVNYEVKSLRREPFDVIYSALESYKAIHGDVNIVKDFVVPHGDARYPENTWGMKLGVIVKNIRNKGYHAKHREQLEALGIVAKSSS